MIDPNKKYCMNCNEGQKLAFIHIPKTAGKSIRSAFKLGWHDKNFNEMYPGQYNCSHRRAKHLTEEVIKNFDTFSVIRNPWDRVVSLYHYYSGRPDMKTHYDKITKYKTFESFVLDLKNIEICDVRDNNKKPGVFPDNFQSCSYFLCDDNDKILIKNLIRFEHLNDDLFHFANKVNMKVSFPLKKHIKDTEERYLGLKHEYYKTYYNDKLIQEVADKYERDIKIFGYEY